MTTESDSVQALLSLQRLLTICSPAFPIGAFSYSGGLEAAVERGDLSDRAQLIDWCQTQLTFGSLRQDIWLMLRAMGSLEDADLAIALRPTSELRLEARQQGRSFIGAGQKGWPELMGDAPAIDWSLAVAFGWCAGRLQLDPVLAGAGFAHAACANFISAAVRAVPLGQSDAVIAQSALERSIDAVVAELNQQDNLPATCTPRVDVYSAQHEVQYSRMFRS